MIININLPLLKIKFTWLIIISVSRLAWSKNTIPRWQDISNDVREAIVAIYQSKLDKGHFQTNVTFSFYSKNDYSCGKHLEKLPDETKVEIIDHNVYGAWQSLSRAWTSLNTEVLYSETWGLVSLLTNGLNWMMQQGPSKSSTEWPTNRSMEGFQSFKVHTSTWLKSYDGSERCAEVKVCKPQWTEAMMERRVGWNSFTTTLADDTVVQKKWQLRLLELKMYNKLLDRDGFRLFVFTLWVWIWFLNDDTVESVVY